MLLLACVLALGACFALPVQQVGCAQSSHLALTRAIADGTPTIDARQWQTCDKSWWHGHYYTSKGPGVALLSVPLWVALDSVGLVSRYAPVVRGEPGVNAATVWPFTVLASVLPALLLLALIALVADRFAPGFGVVTAVAGVVGSLILPYATLYSAQVLSTVLGFGAFALLVVRPSPRSTVLAGLLAGLACVVDYPLALLAVLIGGYVLVFSERRWNAALRYGAGLVAGIAPLLAFNTWAFGTPFHQAYQYAVVHQGLSGHDQLGANSSGFYGIGVPRPHVLLELLFAGRGLLVVTPLLGLALAGCFVSAVPSLRRVARFGALVFTAYLVYNAGYYLPFGGFTPGPRFLIPALPFLLAPLAVMFKRFPVATGVLTLVSAAGMVAATVTRPMIGLDESPTSWFDDIASGHFTATIFAAHRPGSGWFAIGPFLVLILVALGIAAASAPWPKARRGDAVVAAAMLVAWALLAFAGPALVGRHTVLSDAALAALAAAVAMALIAVVRQNAVRTPLPLSAPS